MINSSPTMKQMMYAEVAVMQASDLKRTLARLTPDQHREIISDLSASVRRVSQCVPAPIRTIAFFTNWN